MKGYLIADVDVKDAAAYEEYRKLVPATIAKYGGTYLVRGGAHEVLEGDWKPARVVVLEFPSVDAARRWYFSEEYRPAKEIRFRAAISRALIVAGA
jgi:uncharacterized protein (DUF1330 family)